MEDRGGNLRLHFFGLRTILSNASVLCRRDVPRGTSLRQRTDAFLSGFSPSRDRQSSAPGFDRQERTLICRVSRERACISLRSPTKADPRWFSGSSGNRGRLPAGHFSCLSYWNFKGVCINLPVKQPKRNDVKDHRPCPTCR